MFVQPLSISVSLQRSRQSLRQNFRRRFGTGIKVNLGLPCICEYDSDSAIYGTRDEPGYFACHTAAVSRSLLSRAKDAAFEKAVLMFLRPKVERYGEILELSLDSSAKL